MVLDVSNVAMAGQLKTLRVEIERAWKEKMMATTK